MESLKFWLWAIFVAWITAPFWHIILFLALVLVLTEKRLEKQLEKIGYCDGAENFYA